MVQSGPPDSSWQRPAFQALGVQLHFMSSCRQIESSYCSLVGKAGSNDKMLHNHHATMIGHQVVSEAVPPIGAPMHR